MLDVSNHSTKYYDISNILIIVKMKDETRSVTIEEFVGLKPKMYSFVNSKIRKFVNRNVVATTSVNEYKDVLLNNKFIRHLMNRIPSTDHSSGSFIVFLLWQNIYPKQWIWWISPSILELTVKK